MRYLKAFVVASLLFLIPFAKEASAQDASAYEAIDQKLEEYFEALGAISPSEKAAEADFLIESCQDEATRQHVALKIYNMFMLSKVMGDEAVPVHLTDKWFAPGKIKMLDDFDRLNAMVFAEFNRQSLLGLPAPEITMETMEGDSLRIMGGGYHRYRILYFFDTGCAKCKIESPLLTRALNNLDYPVDLYTVYTGSSKEAWSDYVDQNFDISAENVNVRHLWDSSRSSDFERKYGVLQTPRMFLVDRHGTIIGRGLDTEALISLLGRAFQLRDYTFGEDESMALYDAIFGNDNSEALSMMIDRIREDTIEVGDTLSFKMMSGDLLYWLSSQRGEKTKQASQKFIQENILDAPGVWLDSWDSLKVVGLGQMMDQLLGKSPIGDRIAPLKVPGKVMTRKGEKAKKVRLDKLKAERNYIIFHTSGCSICEKELELARNMIENEPEDNVISVLSVDFDQIIGKNPKLAEKLMDTFDLSGLPFMMQTNRDGTIRRKYMSLQPKQSN